MHVLYRGEGNGMIIVQEVIIVVGGGGGAATVVENRCRAIDRDRRPPRRLLLIKSCDARDRDDDERQQ